MVDFSDEALEGIVGGAGHTSRLEEESTELRPD